MVPSDDRDSSDPAKSSRAPPSSPDGGRPVSGGGPLDDDPPVFDEPSSLALRSARPHASFRRILVIDDHIDATAALELFFSLRGYEAASAGDGLAGLALAESFRPEVVLLDLGLPKLDGFDTARRLRREAWGRYVLIVALSGLESKADKQRAFAAGIDHFVGKPVLDVEGFLAQLNQWVNAH